MCLVQEFVVSALRLSRDRGRHEQPQFLASQIMALPRARTRNFISKKKRTRNFFFYKRLSHDDIFFFFLYREREGRHKLIRADFSGACVYWSERAYGSRRLSLSRGFATGVRRVFLLSLKRRLVRHLPRIGALQRGCDAMRSQPRPQVKQTPCLLL